MPNPFHSPSTTVLYHYGDYQEGLMNYRTPPPGNHSPPAWKTSERCEFRAQHHPHRNYGNKNHHPSEGAWKLISKIISGVSAVDTAHDWLLVTSVARSLVNLRSATATRLFLLLLLLLRPPPLIESTAIIIIRGMDRKGSVQTPLREDINDTQKSSAHWPLTPLIDRSTCTC